MKKWLVGIVLVILVLVLIIFGRSWYGQARRLKLTTTPGSQTVTVKGSPKYNEFSLGASQGKCKGTGTTTFTHLPMNIDDIGSVQPYGVMVGAHVIPTSHGYLYPAHQGGPRDEYPVYAIADSTLVEISHRGQAVGDNTDPNHKTDEYQLWFEHSCTFYSYYDLLTSLSPDLQKVAGTLGTFENKWVRIPIKAGQEVGRVGGQTVDFGVWNFEKQPNYFANPASYEGNRPFLDDMFASFAPALKTQLLAKDVRTVEPRSGKVNYDIPGKLIGGWFQEGTGGFNGPPHAADNGGKYWDGHLAIVYDYIDPTSITVSMGNYDGTAKQFSVKGNTPDPATIGVDSGLVKYELVLGKYIDGDTGQPWMMSPPIAHPKSVGTGEVQGTILVQMTATDKLKVEIFPNKTAAQITGFDTNAKIYTR